MGQGIDGRALVQFGTKADIEASFVSDLRLCAFFLTGKEVIIDRSVEVLNKFFRICPLVGDKRAYALDLSLIHI